MSNLMQRDANDNIIRTASNFEKNEHANQAVLFEHETSRSQRHVCISLF
jgi:hypothetical protein